MRARAALVAALGRHELDVVSDSTVNTPEQN
jgi:hypothetical protein